MLIITRKTGEAFYVGENVCVTVEDIKGDKIKISIDAPKDVPILRKELKEAQTANAEAANVDSAIISKLMNTTN